MAKYRKRPVVIEAMRLDGSTVRVAEWMTENGCAFRTNTHPTDSTLDEVIIPTLEGEMRADPGDYIIRGVQGEFYPCKPDIFEATYEAVRDAE